MSRDDLLAHATALVRCESREDALGYAARLRGQTLAGVCDLFGVHPRGPVDQVRQRLVANTVGAVIDHATMLYYNQPDVDQRRAEFLDDYRRRRIAELTAEHERSATTPPAAESATSHDGVTAMAEVTGLATAIDYAGAQQQAARESADDVAAWVEALQDQDVAGDAVTASEQAAEHYRAAAEAFGRARAALERHLQVGEAYQANPDAGSRPFVTAESDGDQGGVATVDDALKLAGRIELGRGESLTGSRAVTGEDGGDLLLAAVHTPSGPRLRVSTGIAEEDRQRWRAGNRGATVNLDAGGAAELRDVLGRMAQAGAAGDARRREMFDRLTGLDQRWRDLVRRQHGLNKTQGRQLDRLDEQISNLRSVRDHVQRRIADRVQRMPPDWQQRYHASDPAGQHQIIKDWYDQDPKYSGVGIQHLHARDVQRLNRTLAELGPAEQHRAELTSGRTPAPDFDESELARVSTERQRLEEDLFQLADSGVLLKGTIGGEWGDLAYEVMMHGEVDNATARYSLAALTPAGLEETESYLTPAQLQQVADAIEASTRPRP